MTAPSGGRIIIWPDGRKEFFGQNNDNTYGKAIGSGNTLTVSGATVVDSIFSVTEPGGSIYRFDFAGRLIELITEPGSEFS